jgi:hypothetical protein
MSVARALARYARAAAVPAEERCQLCGAAVATPHPHVVELRERSLLCACLTCARLFADGSGRYRLVPSRVLVDPGAPIGDGEFATLQVPVDTAFAFYNSLQGRWNAFYPSPGGPVEAELPTDAWESIAARHRLVAAIAPDVEALLMHRSRRRRDRPLDCFLAPIDTCYELVALVRRNFRGFDGGAEAWRAIDAFFDALRARSRPLAGGLP